MMDEQIENDHSHPVTPAGPKSNRSGGSKSSSTGPVDPQHVIHSRKRRLSMMRRFSCLAILGLLLVLATQGTVAQTFQQGDVFVSAQGDVVEWHRADGSLVQVLHTGV